MPAIRRTIDGLNFFMTYLVALQMRSSVIDESPLISDTDYARARLHGGSARRKKTFHAHRFISPHWLQSLSHPR
jgi:hypothetical protein